MTDLSLTGIERRTHEIELTVWGKSGSNGISGTVKHQSNKIAELYGRDEETRQKMDEGFADLRKEMGTKFRWVYVQLGGIFIALVGGMAGVIAALVSMGGATP